MKFQDIKLSNFKNHENAYFQFVQQFVCITGPNGVGKTNILDALHYISMMRSYFNYSDNYAIKHGSHFFRIEAHIIEDDRTRNKGVLKKLKSDPKELSVSGLKVDKRLDHIGKWPIIFVSPGDHRLLMYEGSKERQRFIDMCLSQVDRNYIKSLSLYHNLLKKRNALLRNYQEVMGSYDMMLLNTIEEQMVTPAREIYHIRKKFVKYLNEKFIHFYGILSGSQEKMTLTYRSHLDEYDLDDVGKMWAETINRDRNLGYTTRGIHRDDLVIKMNGRVLRNYGSQGQIKSMVIALKLAQLSYMETHLVERPVLLLDDIFEKLDDTRLNQLMKIFSKTEHGGIFEDIQVFITDTSPSRSTDLLSEHGINYTHISLELQDEEE